MDEFKELLHNPKLQEEVNIYKHVLDKLTPEFFEKYKPKREWFYRRSELHGIPHELRVLVFTELIGHDMDIDHEALRWSAITHDTQRHSEGIDYLHGTRSSEWVESKFPELKNIKTVSYINKWHVPSDSEAPEMTKELAVFKDADALDRWRINDLDENYLRTKNAKQLIQISKNLFEISSSLQYKHKVDEYNCVIKALEMIKN